MNRIGKNPASVQEEAMFEGEAHATALAILQSQISKPYHSQRVQPLENVDYQQRRTFCLLFYTQLQLNRSYYLLSDMCNDEALSLIHI